MDRTAGLALDVDFSVTRSVRTPATHIFIPALALLSVQLANPEPVSELIRNSRVDTFIGVGVGVLAAVLTRSRETSGSVA